MAGKQSEANAKGMNFKGNIKQNWRFDTSKINNGDGGVYRS